jgi:murein DD-endopeptidase
VLQLLLLILGLNAVSVQEPPRAPNVQSVDLAVPFQPVSFRQGDRDQVVYELHLTNFARTDAVVTAVRVESNRGPLIEYRAEELHRRITRPGLRNDHPEPQLLAPGMRAVIHLWIPLRDAAIVPTSIDHVVELTLKREERVETVTVQGGATTLAMVPAVVLGAPLKGGPWVAIYDPLLKGGHRTAIYTLEGRARIPGRFAIDFIELPPQGGLARDPKARPTTGNGWGADVLAVADGTIVTAQDGVPDGMPQPVAPEIASGNYVVLDLGSARFAFYEHLQRGSVRVKRGDKVRRGEVLAKLGSSGSSSIGPHLHFHVADANQTLAAEGLPFVFRAFTGLGEFRSLDALFAGDKWIPGQLARPAEQMRPTPNAVISFP